MPVSYAFVGGKSTMEMLVDYRGQWLEREKVGEWDREVGRGYESLRGRRGSVSW